MSKKNEHKAAGRTFIFWGIVALVLIAVLWSIEYAVSFESDNAGWVFASFLVLALSLEALYPTYRYWNRKDSAWDSKRTVYQTFGSIVFMLTASFTWANIAVTVWYDKPEWIWGNLAIYAIVLVSLYGWFRYHNNKDSNRNAYNEADRRDY